MTRLKRRTKKEKTYIKILIEDDKKNLDWKDVQKDQQEKMTKNNLGKNW